MAAPNLASPSTITARSAVIALTTAAQDLIANAAASGKVFQVTSLIIANIDGANNAGATASFVDASPSATRKLANGIVVPFNASLQLLDKDTPIFLEEGDKLTGLATANTRLEVVMSWLEIS